MIKKNSSLKEMGQELIKAHNVLIFPHVLMDGDALGSAAALCHTLRNAGKTAYILLEDPVPAYLTFLDKDYCTDDRNIIPQPDVSIAVDCGDDSRFPKRAKSSTKQRWKCAWIIIVPPKGFTILTTSIPVRLQRGNRI